MSYQERGPDLSNTDRRLINLLDEAADEWGAYGVLRTAATMWPSALDLHVRVTTSDRKRRWWWFR